MKHPFFTGRSSVAPDETPVFYKRSSVAPAETPVFYKRSSVALDGTPLFYERSCVALAETPALYKRSSVAPAETPVFYKRASVAPAETPVDSRTGLWPSPANMALLRIVSENGPKSDPEVDNQPAVLRHSVVATVSHRLGFQLGLGLNG